MKKLFWALLLINVIFFSVMQWGGAWWGKQVLHEQPSLHVEMINLADVPPSGTVGTALPSAARTSSAQPETHMNGQICLVWGEFAGADLNRAIAALATLQLGNKLSQHQVEHSIGYWVYIPPLADRAAVNQKLAQLKALGIDEYFVVQEAGSWRNAISLGIFKTQEAAQHFLEGLSDKGVRTARVGERASKVKVTRFRLSGVSATDEAQMNVIKKDFADSELKNVPCTLTR